MRHRRLGRTGMQVSEIGYGAWQIGGNMWGAVSADRARDAIRAAIDSGITFFDTALAYGHNRSEALLGEVVRRSDERDRLQIATKVPPRNWQWPARPEYPLRDVYPGRWIRECAEQSLRNLDTGPIDLLQLHVWTDAWAHDDEWFDALSRLREDGLIRAFGVSINSHEPESALEVTRSGRIDTLQLIYNVFDPTPAEQLLPLAQEMDVGVIVRVPLDEGALAGRMTADTRFAPGDFREKYFAGDRLPETVERVERLRPLLEGDGQSMAQGALRFCLSHESVSTVIAGSTDPEHVRRNAEVSDLGPLAPEVLSRLADHAWNRDFYA